MTQMKRNDTEKLTNQEKAVINSALIMLRDLHWKMYTGHSKPNGDVAQHSKTYAEAIDELRGKVFDL
jgi:hypothetical protein